MKHVKLVLATLLQQRIVVPLLLIILDLRLPTLSRPISADVKVTKIGTEITVQNPDVEMEFPNGNNKYATNKVVYHNIPFPDDIAINSGDKVISLYQVHYSLGRVIVLMFIILITKL